MKRVLLLCTLLAGAAAAQTRVTPPSITLNGTTYDTTQGMPADMKRQVDAYRSAPPPELVSRSSADAARLIMTERQALSALLGPLNANMTAALNKAAIRPSVGLPPGTTLKFPNALTFRLERAPQTSVIAAGPYMIVVQGAEVQIYKSAFMASKMHEIVKKMREIDARR